MSKLSEHQPQAQTALSRGYIPSLDGLRAVSILVVLTAHSGLSSAIPGGFGVTVFFFLSGFLITTLLVREWDRHGNVSFRAFYLRRVVRLAPPLVLTMVLAYGLAFANRVPAEFDTGALISQIFFFYNYFNLHISPASSVDGLSILWSLSVEEQFYLIWPVLFVLIAKRWMRIPHVVALLGVILIWRLVRFHLLGDSYWTIYLSTDTRFDSLLFGCLLALMGTWGPMPDWVNRPKVMYGLLGCGLIGLMISFVIRDPAFRSTFRYTLQGIALMPIFYFAITQSDTWLFRPLNWAFVRRLGLYSYTCYLVHFVMMHLLEGFGLQRGDPIIYIPAVMVLSFGWAALVHEIAERPLKPLRARLTGHPKETSPAPHNAP